MTDLLSQLSLSSSLAGNLQPTVARGLLLYKPGGEVTPLGHSTEMRDKITQGALGEPHRQQQQLPLGLSRKPPGLEVLPGAGSSSTDRSARRASALVAFLGLVHCFPFPSPVLNERKSNSRKAHLGESHVLIHCSRNSKPLTQWLQGQRNLSWLKKSCYLRH